MFAQHTSLYGCSIYIYMIYAMCRHETFVFYKSQFHFELQQGNIGWLERIGCILMCCISHFDVKFIVAPAMFEGDYWLDSWVSSVKKMTICVSRWFICCVMQESECQGDLYVVRCRSMCVKVIYMWDVGVCVSRWFMCCEM